MDVVLIGLPGSGKSVVGKRLAHRHGAEFIDLDERIERADGRPIPTIFAEDGEATFRTLEREAVADLGPADEAPEVRRVIATGGGAVVDPRNRWALYRGRMTVWLDGRPEILAQRLRRSPHVRPLVQGRDPIGAMRDLAARRERFYAAARIRSAGVAEVSQVVERIEERLAAIRPDGPASPAGLETTILLDASTPIGRIWLGDGHRRRGRPPGAPSARGDAGHRRHRARRVGRGRRSVRRRARDARLAGRADRAPAGRGSQAAGRHRDGRRGAGPGPRRAQRADHRDRWRRPGGRGRVPGRDLPAGHPGDPRADHARRPDRFRRSAARPRSTWSRARTSSAPSTSRPRSSSTWRCCGHCPNASAAPPSARP